MIVLQGWYYNIFESFLPHNLILIEIPRRDCIWEDGFGFAAETQNLIENAREKALKKKLSLIVANDVTAKDSGFFVDTNRVTIIDAGGGAQTLPLMSKAEVAEAVGERVEKLL